MTTIKSGAAVTVPSDLQWFDTMPGEKMAVRMDSKHLGGAVTIIEASVPPNSGPPAHMHKEREEAFEILEGCRLALKCKIAAVSVAFGI